MWVNRKSLNKDITAQINEMEIKPLDNKEEEILKLFLLNMNLLIPSERSVIIKMLDNLYGYDPIEKDFVEKNKNA